MVNPMKGLLGLAQAATIGAPDPLAPTQGQESPVGQIDVEADRIDPYAYENPAAVTKRDMGLQSGREASDHRGMFGTRGTLRDVLGIVGDAFLLQSGNDPIYRPKREQERLSDAMAGFTEDPIAAIERVAGVNPEAAAKMHEQYLLNEDRMSDNNRMSIDTRLNQDKERRIAVEQLADFSARLLSAAGDDPQAMQDALARITSMSSNLNISLEELGLDAAMTPGQMAVYAKGGMTPYQQNRLPQMQQGLNIRERATDISDRRAREQARANRAREGQAAANEEGRNTRNQINEQGRMERSKRGNGGPRSLRGSEGDADRQRFY